VVRTDEFPLPPMRFIRAALRRTTERIARELDVPQEQAPDWSDFEWRVAMAVAAMHGVSALLANRLRWQGSEVWQAFLSEQLQQGLLRQARTRQLLAEIDTAARQAQLPLLALKGSALLKLDLYAPGERPQSDIDLLCREQDFEAAGRLIQPLGYEAGLMSWKHLEYLPAGIGKERAFGEHIGNPVKIELHSRIIERLPLREVAITDQLFPQAASAGLNPYPSLAALMRHLLLHAAGNMCPQGIRLIHLHDIAALATRMQGSDWEELLQPAAGWMLPPLVMVDRYFPGRIPAQHLARTASCCSPHLRWASRHYRIAEHSLSRLNIPRFPCVEWSSSLAEACACAALRIYPGRKAAALNATLALSTHALAATGWAELPRWKKALRVLAGNAPRVATMYSIQRAMSYRPGTSSPANSASMRAAV